MIETSTTTNELMAAILAFQKTVRAVKRDAKNPHFKSKYATLENVMDAAKPVLNDGGVIIQQFPGEITDNGLMVITTQLLHAESGQYIRNIMQMPLGKRDPQGTGSTMTYAMRYSLMAILGLPPTDDDDAESATDRGEMEPAASPKSSAQLKRKGSWEAVKEELDSDLADCHSLVAVETLKARYRERVKSEGWNKSFTTALADVFEAHEEHIRQQMEVLEDNPLMAG